MRFLVSAFSQKDLFGFVIDEDGSEFFFHAQDFHRKNPGGPLPIVGEEVEIEGIVEGGKRPRASIVTRQTTPVPLEGIVASFDSNKGWGFVDYGVSDKAFFHMSDRAVEWMPVIGSRIIFFKGYKSGRARVCWARPLRGT